MSGINITDFTRGRKDEIPEGENILLFNLPAYYVNDLMAIAFGKIAQKLDEDAEVYLYSSDQTVTLYLETTKPIRFDDVVGEAKKYLDQPFLKTVQELADLGKEWASAKRNKKYDKLLDIYDRYTEKFKEFEKIYETYHGFLDMIMSSISGKSIDQYYNSKKKYLTEKHRQLIVDDPEKALKKVKISTGSGDFDDVFNSNGYIPKLMKIINKKKVEYKVPTSFDIGTQFVKTTEYTFDKDKDNIRRLTPLEYALFLIGAIETNMKVHSIKNTSAYFIFKPTTLTALDDVIDFYRVTNDTPLTEYTYVKINEEGQKLPETRKIYSSKLSEEDMLEKMLMNLLLRTGYGISVYQRQSDMLAAVNTVTVDKNLSTIYNMYIDAVILIGNTKKVIRFVPRDFLDTLEYVGITFTGKAPKEGEHTQIIVAIHRYFNVPLEKNDLIGKLIKNEKNITVEIDGKKYYVDQKILNALATMTRRSAVA